MMRMLNGEDSPPATVSSSPDITHNTNVEQFEFDAGSMKDRPLQQEVELARVEQETLWCFEEDAWT